MQKPVADNCHHAKGALKNKIIIVGLLAFVILGEAAMAMTPQVQLFQVIFSLNKLSNVAQGSQFLAKVQRSVTATAKKKIC